MGWCRGGHALGDSMLGKEGVWPREGLRRADRGWRRLGRAQGRLGQARPSLPLGGDGPTAREPGMGGPAAEGWRGTGT